MTLSVLEAHATAHGLAITLITEAGLEPLEGSCDEVARLAQVMEQVSVLAQCNEHDHVWLEDVVVGEATVKLGLARGGQARVRIDRG